MANAGAVGIQPQRVVVAFDDERAVADAGVVLPAALGGRLGIEALVDQAVNLGDRPGAANRGAKVMTLVSAMALGADCMDDCDLLCAGRTGQVLGHQVAAPSTLGTFVRAFTFGHVRQLDRVVADSLTRAVQAGAWPREQGAAFGYTRQRGYQPILASRARHRRVLHIRLRTGSANTARGMLRFADELIALVERAGAIGPNARGAGLRGGGRRRWRGGSYPREVLSPCPRASSTAAGSRPPSGTRSRSRSGSSW
jgi:hypothetical protein